MTDNYSTRLLYEQTSNVLGEQIDEMLNRNGQVNLHWHAFMQILDTLGLAEMESRDKEVRRLLRENGVTYVLHGERQGHRPWELDPIPLIISNADWQAISDGLTQRAELLNLVLTDLYGETHLNQGWFDTAGSGLCACRFFTCMCRTCTVWVPISFELCRGFGAWTGWQHNNTR